MNSSELLAHIKSRRSIFPKQYNKTPIQSEVLMEILEAANWAPTHKLTQPWRFKVIRGKKLEGLGDLSAELYKALTPVDKFSEVKFQKKARSPRQAGCVVAICMHRDPNESIPEWEEVAAVACAVQNMWLMTTAHNIGAYWSSPGIIEHEKFQKFVQLEEGERCLGLFYMGHYDEALQQGRRDSIGPKVNWLEG